MTPTPGTGYGAPPPPPEPEPEFIFRERELKAQLIRASRLTESSRPRALSELSGKCHDPVVPSGLRGCPSIQVAVSLRVRLRHDDVRWMSGVDDRGGIAFISFFRLCLSVPRSSVHQEKPDLLARVSEHKLSKIYSKLVLS